VEIRMSAVKETKKKAVRGRYEGVPDKHVRQSSYVV